MMQPMRRESPYPMVPIEEAQRIIAAHAAPLGAEEISSLTADGRVLAEDVYAGDNIHTVGQDIARGALVLVRGTALGAAAIGLLATIGRVRISAFRRPIVAV